MSKSSILIGVGIYTAGALSTLFSGAVMSRIWDANLYDAVRVRSVSPASKLLGEHAQAVSKWTPSFLWYSQYASVKSEYANVRIMETMAAPIIEKLSQNSCVMVLKNSDLDPAWIKFEQRVDGKTVTGYMHTENLRLEDAHIGRPCVAYSYGG